MVAVHHQVACDLWHTIGEEGEHENLGVVEDVTPIPEARQALCRDTGAVIMQRGVDAQLIDIVPYPKLGLVVTFDENVCSLPEVVPCLMVLCKQRVISGGSHLPVMVERGRQRFYTIA